MQYNYSAWRIGLKLECILCEQKVTAYYELIDVLGDKERKAAVCHKCVKALKKHFSSLAKVDKEFLGNRA
jgi:hypothetical protein